MLYSSSFSPFLVGVVDIVLFYALNQDDEKRKVEGSKPHLPPTSALKSGEWRAGDVIPGNIVPIEDIDTATKGSPGDMKRILVGDKK